VCVFYHRGSVFPKATQLEYNLTAKTKRLKTDGSSSLSSLVPHLWKFSCLVALPFPGVVVCLFEVGLPILSPSSQKRE
jgi:hypothetical protein